MSISGIPPVPARVQEIAQRIGARTEPGGGSSDLPAGPAQAAPLGFGLLLEQQRAGGAALGSWASASRASFTPAIQRSPGQYGPLTPPPELVVYGNGKIPPGVLAPVGNTGHTLWAPAARGLETLVAHAAADGVSISITDSYRPLAAQERLAEEKGLYAHGGLAAVPGTSNHGWGMSADLDLDDAGRAWMRENAWKYGFVEDVPREPWHWTYRPSHRS